jgi:hypothetical protein
MGQRPKDPNEAFAKRAKEVIDQALEQQGVVTQELLAKSGENIGPGYETYAETLDKIGGASDRTFPQYVRNAESKFFGTADQLTKQGRRGLRNFRPDLLASDSTSQVTDYLTAVGQDFSRGVREVGESGRDRLFALPEQAQMAFTSSAINPAFENLRNAGYVNFAKEPPTVANDAMKMYRNMFTYNV